MSVVILFVTSMSCRTGTGDAVLGDVVREPRDTGSAGGGITESRFIRLVSVGLTVLAPKPVAWV